MSRNILKEEVSMGRTAIPDEIKDETFSRLDNHVQNKYMGRYGVKNVISKFKGRYLYIDWVEGITDDGVDALKELFPNELSDEAIRKMVNRSKKDTKPSKLCRLRYTGDIDFWELEIYKYSDDWYDTEREFLFSGGTIEECFDAAASLYITQTFP
jgi:hypothetical protein